MSDAHKPKRRRFPYVLLLFVLLVGMGMSWLTVKIRRARKQRAAVEAINTLGGSARYNYMLTWCGYETGFTEPTWVGGLVNPYAVDECGNLANPEPGTPVPMWIRSLLGDDFFADIVRVDIEGPQVTDAGLEHLEGLTQLKWLYLLSTEVTDTGLEHLKGLTQLQELFLNGTKVTGTGLEHLKGLNQLRILDLRDTKITDTGLEHLKGWPQLRALLLERTEITDTGLERLKRLTKIKCLFLGSTKVTDAGLEHLNGMTNLAELWLEKTTVTDAGVQKLQRVLPKCHIVH